MNVHWVKNLEFIRDFLILKFDKIRSLWVVMFLIIRKVVKIIQGDSWKRYWWSYEISREIFRNHKRVFLKSMNRAFSISLKKEQFFRNKKTKIGRKSKVLKGYFGFLGLQSLSLFKIEIVSLSKVVSHGF